MDSEGSVGTPGSVGTLGDYPEKLGVLCLGLLGFRDSVSWDGKIWEIIWLINSLPALSTQCQ